MSQSSHLLIKIPGFTVHVRLKCPTHVHECRTVLRLRTSFPAKHRHSLFRRSIVGMSYPGAPPPHPPPPQMLYQPHVAPQMPPHLPPPPTAQAVAGVAVPPPSSASAASSFASVMRSAATASFGSGGAAGNVGGGQSLTDRVNAARYALAGQGLARVVCKATTEEVLPPKKKHLDCEFAPQLRVRLLTPDFPRKQIYCNAHTSPTSRSRHWLTC